MLQRLTLLLCALLVALPAWAGGLVVDMLDVGQGDGILIRTKDKVVLIDASVRQAGVVGQLQRLGVDHVDLAIATHPHADHIGGMGDVVRALPVKLYIDNGLPHTTKTYDELMDEIEQRGIAYRKAQRGMTLRLGDEATLEVLFPDTPPLRDTRSDLNSNSVVVRLVHGEVSFLFTGDAEEPTEQALLRNGLGHSDVLKVAHHGSEHSSTPGFLRTVAPSIALISVGEGNRYGHPDPEAVERLKRAGALVYRTDQSGQLRVISDGHAPEVLEGTLAEFAAMPLPWAARATATSERRSP